MRFPDAPPVQVTSSQQTPAQVGGDLHQVIGRSAENHTDTGERKKEIHFFSLNTPECYLKAEPQRARVLNLPLHYTPHTTQPFKHHDSSQWLLPKLHLKFQSHLLLICMSLRTQTFCRGQDLFFKVATKIFIHHTIQLHFLLVTER